MSDFNHEPGYLSATVTLLGQVRLTLKNVPSQSNPPPPSPPAPEKTRVFFSFRGKTKKQVLASVLPFIRLIRVEQRCKKNLHSMKNLTQPPSYLSHNSLIFFPLRLFSFLSYCVITGLTAAVFSSKDRIQFTRGGSPREPWFNFIQ